jgi:hypothetical protein
MSLKSAEDLLGTLSPAARHLAETQLRAEGLLASDASLEDAFAPKRSGDIADCLLGCSDAFEATMATCTTDECRAGAAVAYGKCKKACLKGD